MSEVEMIPINISKMKHVFPHHTILVHISGTDNYRLITKGYDDLNIQLKDNRVNEIVNARERLAEKKKVKV